MLWLDQLLILLPGLALAICAQTRLSRALADASQLAAPLPEPDDCGMLEI